MTEGTPGLGPILRRIAALPLRVRRRLVRAWFLNTRLTGALRRPFGRGAERIDPFQRVLRLPRREAARLRREAALHDVSAELEWLALSRRSLPGIERDMAHIRVANPEVLERVAATGRPVILAPLHMGAYVIGLAHTMLRFFPGRPLLILRQRDDMAMETAVMERIRAFGVEMRFLKVTERGDFLAAVRFAQKGAVIVVFCDLPPGYGAPAAMPMFGLPLSFAFGHDALARLTGATVVPWSTAMEPDGDTVRAGRPFEVHGGGPQDRAEAAALMGAHIREALRGRPEQWHLWATLDDYLPARETVGTERAPGGGAALADAA